MTTADGEDHRRLRSLVSKAFTAPPGRGTAAPDEELTAGLLDDLRAAAERDGGVADLRRHLAICAAHGGRRGTAGWTQTRDRLHHLSNQVVATDIGPEKALAANRELVAVLAAVAVARGERPGDDLAPAR